MKLNSLTKKLLLFSLPFWILGFLLFLRFDHFYTYEALGREDNLVENLQAIIFIAASIIAFVVANRFRKTNEKILSIVFLLFAVASFIIAMEEISWGQRILNYSTPDILTNDNVQGEANLHNLNQFHYKIYIFNLAAAIYGSFSWILKLLLQKNKHIGNWIQNLTIPWYLSSYFTALFINQFFPYFMPQDFESVELIFALGLMLFAISRLLRFRERINTSSF